LTDAQSNRVPPQRGQTKPPTKTDPQRVPPKPPTQPPPQQDPTEVVELRSDLVVVTVTVTGLRGELVKGLTRDDFEVLEEGVSQQLVEFSGESAVPLRLVVVLDASLSIKSRFDFEKQAVARFFKSSVRQTDRAALMSVSTDVVLQQGFTSDVTSLVAAVNAVKSEGATALYDAVYEAADYLNTAQGRRVIVILSDGRDTISRTTLAQTLRRVQDVDAVIYGINTSNQEGSANLRELIGETALETMGNQTGGEVFFPNTLEELDPIFARLTERLRTQYVMGFHSTNEARDGAFRRLTVRVKREGAVAKARNGYYAPKK
jgi:Ca-activated chloride channel family protein